MVIFSFWQCYEWHTQYTQPGDHGSIVDLRALHNVHPSYPPVLFCHVILPCVQQDMRIATLWMHMYDGHDNQQTLLAPLELAAIYW